nr:uncharacterized protein LOC119169938 [Rhipicephalus microplus]
MTLKRLQWIAAVLNFLAAVQSGFRSHRSTMDPFSNVVIILADAKLRGDAGYLVLLDTKSTFDNLPRVTVSDALRAMGVCGSLLGHVQKFLGGRALCVHIDGDLSAPRPSTG